MPVLTGEKEYFKGIGQIKYEGPGSDNPFAYRWYDAGKVVAGILSASLPISTSGMKRPMP
jgi:xylose isomerase